MHRKIAWSYHDTKAMLIGVVSLQLIKIDTTDSVNKPTYIVKVLTPLSLKLWVSRHTSTIHRCSNKLLFVITLPLRNPPYILIEKMFYSIFELFRLISSKVNPIR